MLKKWVFAKLEPVQDQALVIVRDPLGLTVNLSTDLHNWSLENGFVSFACNTNLLFRYKYEFIRAHEDVKKLLILDQTPLSRRQQAGTQSRQSRATPPFYPDVLALASPQARIDLDLRQYLIEETNDPLWPHETNQPKYAQLIARHLPAVLKAYENLRVADRSRFTDSDFETIVGYAALGAPQAAFTKPSAQTYWEIGLLAHNQLEALDAIAPDLSRRIHDELRKAAPPFCWFADANADTDTVIRAFYTSLVLAQHTNYWKLLLANVDPGYKAYSEIDPAVLDYAGPELVRSDPAQAEQDIQSMERELSKEALTMILLDELKINEPGGFAGLIERERYLPAPALAGIVSGLEGSVEHTGATSGWRSGCGRWPCHGASAHCRRAVPRGYARPCSGWQGRPAAEGCDRQGPAAASWECAASRDGACCQPQPGRPAPVARVGQPQAGVWPGARAAGVAQGTGRDLQNDQTGQAR